MIYIDTIKLPSQDEINDYLSERNYSLYPWTIFFQNQFEWVSCKDITIFYGSNGSGKSTLLNLIAEKIGAQRTNTLFKDVIYNDYKDDTNSFDKFVEAIEICMSIDANGDKYFMPAIRKIITGDSIFKKIEDRISHNRVTVNKISKVIAEYNALRYHATINYVGSILDKPDELKKFCECNKMTEAQYVKAHTEPLKRMLSNGETVLEYYQTAFENGGIYLLDEPENCLSPAFQVKLINMIQDSAKYFDCQFIICTHSPFILGLDNAVIYNLDTEPVIPQKWEELENVKIYFDFFEARKDRFK